MAVKKIREVTSDPKDLNIFQTRYHMEIIRSQLGTDKFRLVALEIKDANSFHNGHILLGAVGVDNNGSIKKDAGSKVVLPCPPYCGKQGTDENYPVKNIEEVRILPTTSLSPFGGDFSVKEIEDRYNPYGNNYYQLVSVQRSPNDSLTRFIIFYVDESTGEEKSLSDQENDIIFPQ